MMVTGINKVFEHDGRSYHIQSEDLGSETGAFEVRVYDQGSVLWVKRISYADLLEQQLPRREHEQSLHAKMEKTIHTVEAAIARGKLG